MKVLWTDQVKSGNGKELYGEDYQDIWAINRLHFKAGGASSCDHVSSPCVSQEPDNASRYDDSTVPTAVHNAGFTIVS